MLYQAKTGTPVFVPLPPHVAEMLRSIPPGLKPNPNYFFWSGNGLPKTFVANWQRAYRRLFKVADLRKLDGTPKRCHCHMFRDTFAVEMLLGRRSHRSGVDPARPRQRPRHGKALLAMGASPPGSA